MEYAEKFYNISFNFCVHRSNKRDILIEFIIKQKADCKQTFEFYVCSPR